MSLTKAGKKITGIMRWMVERHRVQGGKRERERERESKTEEGEIKSDVKVVKESTEVWSKGGDEE